MDEDELQRKLDTLFDEALVYHAYTDYMRDYEMVVFSSADPRSTQRPTYRRYLFEKCVYVATETAVRKDVWPKSLDERLIHGETSVDDVEGFVWAVRFQVLYPGARLLRDSERARQWSGILGENCHEVRIEANGHNVNLVFVDLDVTEVDEGYSPFTVGPPFNDGRIPLH